MVETANISVHVRGDTCAAIRAIATSETTSLGRVAARLIEAGLEARDASTAPAGQQIDVGDLPFATLLDELNRRFLDTASVAERNTAIARAEAAEAQLADMRAKLAALVDA